MQVFSELRVPPKLEEDSKRTLTTYLISRNAHKCRGKKIFAVERSGGGHGLPAIIHPRKKVRKKKEMSTLSTAHKHSVAEQC